MRTIVAAVFGAGLFLSGCSGGYTDTSRLNPLNWFERNKETQPATEIVAPQTTAQGELIPLVKSVKAEPFSTGIILIASGVPPTFGYYNPTLEPINDGRPLNGELVFELRATRPEGEVTIGTEESREINVATTLNSIQLSGVDSIRVIGAVNEQIVNVNFN